MTEEADYYINGFIEDFQSVLEQAQYNVTARVEQIEDLISERIQEIVYEVQNALEQFEMTPEEYFVRVNVREIYEANVAMQAESPMTLEDFIAQLEAYLRGVCESNMALQSEQMTAEELMARIEASLREMLESNLNVQAADIDLTEL